MWAVLSFLTFAIASQANPCTEGFSPLKKIEYLEAVEIPSAQKIHFEYWTPERDTQFKELSVRFESLLDRWVTNESDPGLSTDLLNLETDLKVFQSVAFEQEAPVQANDQVTMLAELEGISSVRANTPYRVMNYQSGDTQEVWFSKEITEEVSKLGPDAQRALMNAAKRGMVYSSKAQAGIKINSTHEKFKYAEIKPIAKGVAHLRMYGCLRDGSIFFVLLSAQDKNFQTLLDRLQRICAKL